jgi:ribosomal protein L40E
LQQDSLAERGSDLDIPEGFFCALQGIFGNEGSYVSPHQREKAVRCLYDAITGTQVPKAEAEEAKKGAFTGDICPDCGGRIIHVSSNGRPCNVCMECGAVTNLKETL